MFGLGKKIKDKTKKSTKKNQETAEVVDPKIAEQIHVMPQRFYVAPPKKRSSSLVIIIGSGVVLIIGLAVAGYFMTKSLTAPATNQPTNLNTNINLNLNANTNQPPANQNINNNHNTNLNSDDNENINANTNANTNLNDNENINANTNQPTNANTNTNTNVNGSPGELPRASDIDNDGLTLVEETLFQTDPNNKDSDNDTYPDSSELLSGFDPSQPNVTLADSGLVLVYQHPNYSILYPAAWQVQELGADGSEVIFQAETGEFIEIIIVSNPERLTLEQWYQDQFPDQSASVEPVTIGEFLGLRTADGRNYYFIDSIDRSQVYLLTYNAGTLNQLNFMLTFNLMVRNFILIR